MRTVDNEAKLQAQVSKGHAAQVELSLTSEAFAAVNAAYMDLWRKTGPHEDKSREKIWIATTILSKVEEHLRQHVQTGKVAVQQLESLKRIAEPAPKKRLVGIF